MCKMCRNEKNKERRLPRSYEKSSICSWTKKTLNWAIIFAKRKEWDGQTDRHKKCRTQTKSHLNWGQNSNSSSSSNARKEERPQSVEATTFLLYFPFFLSLHPVSPFPSPFLCFFLTLSILPSVSLSSSFSLSFQHLTFYVTALLRRK